MDYAKLRASALRTSEEEEAVTVDTRALIDKVLARYSGEWTTLRELIQNAADAQATSVQIKWETLPSTQVPLPATSSPSELVKHVLSHHTLRRLVVQNNGQPFTKTDWARLKRIAEGNPDETKIGAFGVGFYSVFADCEEPFVSSGNEAMAFYWKGNALFTRKLQVPQDQRTGDTAFVLDYRNTTTPVPNLLSVGQFLATSLTFVALQSIEFWIDDWKILGLQKKSSPSVGIEIPRDLETRTRDGLMSLASAERMSAQIDATFMSVLGWKPQPASTSHKSNDPYYSSGSGSEKASVANFFARLSMAANQAGLRGKAAKEEKAIQDAIVEDLTAMSTSSIFLRITSAQIRTHVLASFATELERATKKPPPKTTKISILTSTYDETIASEQSSGSSHAAKAADVFSSVLPSKKPGGRIFIGFPTTQTTGAAMHISAPSVIPTVEREAIDLNARWVSNWNVAMLRVASILSRLAYVNEMSDLNKKLQRMAQSNKGAVISAANIQTLIPEALHILKTFTFSDSTPNTRVAEIFEESFWVASNRPDVDVFSSRGVLSTDNVRNLSKEIASFAGGIPMIVEDMKGSPFISTLINYGLIRDITNDDIFQELSAKALDKEQLRHFLAWLAKGAASGLIDKQDRDRLLMAAVATVSEVGDSGDIITLGTISNYQSNKIPSTLPIPPTTLPITLYGNIPEAQLRALGWEPLGLAAWLAFVVESGPSRSDEQNIAKSAPFSVHVLGVISKNWDSLSETSKSSIVALLQNTTAIPTKMGMRKPGESFFASVKLFDDLPTVEGCHNLKEKFLVALGVRKTVDLETIFARLLNPSPDGVAAGHKKWSHMELIKYLASVKNDIPAADMEKLKKSKLCPAEAGPPGLEPTKGSSQLYKVSELYEPKASLRELKLPILHWPGPPGSFRSTSAEGAFLISLGLRTYPTVPVLVELMASPDATLRETARAYFISYHQTNGYNSYSLASMDKPFLPLQGNPSKLVAPFACYTNERARVLGYDILAKELHPHAPKFGVASDPPISGCVERLIANPPKDRQLAIRLFDYFATRAPDLSSGHRVKLSQAPIVPINRKKTTSASSQEKSDEVPTLVQPQNCYLGRSTAYDRIFDFVDFGANANVFLLMCGAKTEPTKTEVAQLACREPARLLSVLQSPEKYLNLLRSLADDLAVLKKDRELFRMMQTSAWLLGFKEISASKNNGNDVTDEDEAPLKQYQLASPSQIVVLDDYISYGLFKKALLCAPEEDSLEAFYMKLGCQTLGSQIQEVVKVGAEAAKQDDAWRLRQHVLERSTLFLYEYSKYKHDSIKHDAKWLEQNLEVKAVRSVTLQRSLKGQNQYHAEKRSAASARQGSAWVLFVASDGRPDMYQVGQAICQMLLTRPSQQAYLFIEPFLKLEVLDLRARGYNVNRILRAKAAEARIAEEERMKALEAEQQKIKKREQEWMRHTREAEAAAARDAAATKTPEPKNRMPGSFGDSPEEEHIESTKQRPQKPNFFSQISRSLGFENTPPPQPLPPAPSQPVSSEQDKKPSTETERVTSPAVIQQNLLNAIQSTRPHDSSQLFAPPQQQEVKEQATYCDSTPGQNHIFAAEAPRGMHVFVSKDVATPVAEFLTQNLAAIAHFEKVLKDIAEIYGMSTRSLHIFFDEVGTTIAFNRNGSIFCNLRFFKQLHADKMKERGSASQHQARADALSWWWVIVAHELAHNLVGPHNSDHSYYTESFIQQYFNKMMAKAATPPPTSPATATSNSAPGNAAQAGPSSLPPPPPYSAQPGYRSLLD